MTEESDSGASEESAEPVEPRWWSTGYAVRLAITLVVISVIVGGIFGPAGLELNRLETRLAGGWLTYGESMYWQAALVQIIPGTLIGGLASFGAVLRRKRPTAAGVLRRIMIGPLVCGVLLFAVLVPWGPAVWVAGLPRVIAMTAIAAGMFALAAVVARLTKVQPQPSSDRPTVTA